jgi:conjugal transfer ATP-binding protein TraC
MDFFRKLFKRKSAVSKSMDQTNASMLAVLPEQIYDKASLELQDVIAPSALKIQSKSINLGEKIARTFFIISYPRYLTDNWLSPHRHLSGVATIPKEGC